MIRAAIAQASARRAQPEAQARVAESDAGMARELPDASFQPGLYGDMAVVPIIFTATGSRFALGRPKETRILLYIRNTFGPNNTVTYNFDAASQATGCLTIVAGQADFYDAVVPQGDLHIWAPAPGMVLVGYINKNIALNDVNSAPLVR